jgi:hypothetical protein
MTSLPPLPLSEMPGFVPLPPIGTPEFAEFARGAIDPDALRALVRHLFPRPIHTQPFQSSSDARPARNGV